MSKIIQAKKRTSAHMVLAAMDVSMEVLQEAFQSDSDASKQLAKIRRWLNEVWDNTDKTRSVRAQKEFERCGLHIDEIKRDIIGPCTTPQAWAAWVVCLDALISDVVSTWDNACGRGWRYLAQTWDTWTRAFIRSVDGNRAQDEGMRLYFAIHNILPGR